MQQSDRCVIALATERFTEHVDTDDRTGDEVVERIAARTDLHLTHDRLAPVRYQLRRAAVGIRHIRI